MKKFSDIFDGASASSGMKPKILVTGLFAAGALLLMLSLPVFSGSGTEKFSGQTEISPSIEISEYAAMLESGLKNTVSRIVGSENVSVMITLESTFENVYVSDASINEAVTADKTDRKSEKQLVLTGASGSTQTPVVVKQLPPKIKGAVIVCERGGEQDIKERVTALAATALNISPTKIYVTGGN